MSDGLNLVQNHEGVDNMDSSPESAFQTHRTITEQNGSVGRDGAEKIVQVGCVVISAKQELPSERLPISDPKCTDLAVHPWNPFRHVSPLNRRRSAAASTLPAGC